MPQTINNKNIFYPPGGILIWIVIFLEIITFTIGIGAFLYQKGEAFDVFSQSQALLNKTYGMVNTLVLVTGGFMMATSLHQLKLGNNQKSFRWIRGATGMGVLFLGIKGYEYYEKMSHGLTMGYDDFFTFYWLLTGFHFIHVLVGVVILLFISRSIKKRVYTKDNHLDVESGGAFWHMCDLIWLFLFPVLYLLN